MRAYFLLAFLWLVFAYTGRADVVYDNFSDGSNSGADKNFGTFPFCAQSFVLSQATQRLEWVKLNLFCSLGASGTFSVLIRDNVNVSGSNIPGGNSYTVATNQSISALGTNFQSVWTGGVGLDLGTTLNAGSYWLEVTTNSANSTLNWAAGTTTYHGNSAFSANGSSWTTDFAGMGGQIAVAVPEPGTFLLGFLAAMGGLACMAFRICLRTNPAYWPKTRLI